LNLLEEEEEIFKLKSLYIFCKRVSTLFTEGLSPLYRRIETFLTEGLNTVFAEGLQGNILSTHLQIRQEYGGSICYNMVYFVLPSLSADGQGQHSRPEFFLSQYIWSDQIIFQGA
jgi:hypothetical protein